MSQLPLGSVGLSRIACLHVPDFRLQASLGLLGEEPLGGLALVDPDADLEARMVVDASKAETANQLRFS